MTVPLEYLVVVFLAGLVTALSTGLGALPFFLTDEVSDRWLVGLWGLAAGIILSASLFGLLPEALEAGSPIHVVAGLLVGVGLVVVADRVVGAHDFEPRTLARADFDKLVLIVGVLTIHSVPEGVAVGVAFAELGLEGDLVLAGIAVPALAVFVSLAVAIVNVPEGLAIAIPMRTYGIGRWQTVGWAVFSGLPQPIGAVLAYYFVTVASGVLPFGFGLAAGAMIYLVARDMLPEAAARGRHLPGRGRRELLVGFVVGLGSMLPLLVVFG
ncbi:ZIP family metal transporter [Natronobeatus ordinarius]|uniref:ZIP family metal transporter n=1 Tax=Natronobeatus ordinarius TaxID=2963433 RepID=UPI0020CEBB70|nr:ZIP family metal transporter [Natronobeatus ordinarius]